MSLWETLQGAAKKAGEAALVAGHKTRLQGEILMVDRDIKGRKQQFGIDLYDHVGPMANSPDFFAADDPLTESLRPPLLAAQREIAALEIKRVRTKESIAQAEIKRKAAFPEPAVTFVDKMKNAGKSAGLAGNEAKLATDLSVVETKIKYEKQVFGERIYEIFVTLEDEKGWLPTDRTIRGMYDQTRQDVEKLQKKRAEKVAELESLGGTYRFDKKPGEKDGAESSGYDAPAAPAGAPAPTPNQPEGMFSSSTTTSQQQDIFAAPVHQQQSIPSSSAGFMDQPSTTPNFMDQTGGLVSVPPPAPPQVPAYSSSSSSSYTAPSAPIAHTSSYMQSSSTMQVSQAPPGRYSDSGGYGSMMGGGFSDNPPMGGYPPQHNNIMGGSAPPNNNGDLMGGFADFAGVSGGGFQQQPPNDPFGAPGTGSNGQQQNPSRSKDANLFLF